MLWHHLQGSSDWWFRHLLHRHWKLIKKARQRKKVLDKVPISFLLALGRLQRMKTTTGRRFHIEVDVEGRSHSGEDDLDDGGRQQKRDSSLHDDERPRASQKKLWNVGGTIKLPILRADRYASSERGAVFAAINCVRRSSLEVWRSEDRDGIWWVVEEGEEVFMGLLEGAAITWNRSTRSISRLDH